MELVSELPSRSIPVGRQYTAILFDPPTRHVVAVSSQKSPFRLFDEEGNSLWEPDGEWYIVGWIDKLIANFYRRTRYF